MRREFVNFIERSLTLLLQRTPFGWDLARDENYLERKNIKKADAEKQEKVDDEGSLPRRLFFAFMYII